MVKAGTKVLRGEVYWVNLDPTIGAEIKKTRPCLVVSPDDMNAVLPRVIVAPLTSKGQALGCRPEVVIGGKSGRLLLDQIRCIDKSRLAGKLGAVDAALWHDVLLKMLS
ncbi:type II toxin-antitoxin system PemK/MazF family toxin [Propionivibrio sp.]|uniref:type II toxin-antitoxin system PemK/MazF family toxin n=1 Tax=Propionivibrio sp. TaxID=2212460 RepID=UPI0025D14906|nr:type II toxin-antitoxin system PemK/MazF family toxin [Propionivibrio sp.]MBK7356625.1 type II toxin-antitoxin system PemK/MazF family toxin [Propionivibrio sp.]MBK8401038.1 type II toxin-antitoxin system PemK/MazF family toxin [Propionivibrio sp.]MBK8744206.1 type II toxin-antitoxin system PemK/MazF family toxin [Propionivibrio sp.]MBK8894323.1 type II toxin-antitoxin system PemK/MazF family toxin [Propionivibrio sp.]MBL0208873.1 type II toxin-antitoxin system PemK/MazF family toxin [Propi